MNDAPQATPEWCDYEGRIAMAVAGSIDTRDIRKVENAGHVTIRGDSSWQTMFNGLVVREGCYYGDWMTELIRQLNGHHEPQEERVFHEIVESLKNPTAMIELGAYWAWYSMWFKSRHPGAVSIIVEPSPANLETACQNINENGLRILAELGGVFPAALRQDGSHGGEHFGVPHVTVAGLMDKYGLEKLSILHADIQGAELEMLKEAEPLLAARKIDHLFVSTHWLQIHHECRDLLQSHGYQLVAEHSPQESFTIDGLIVARSPELPPFQVLIHRRHV